MELEQQLGARLLARSKRRVSPTEAGRAYDERCLDVIARIEETEREVSRLHNEPRGVLRVNAPVSFGVLHLGPAIAEFLASHPDLRIELARNDRFVDPIEEGVDVTVRIAELADSGLIARRLAPAHRVPIGAVMCSNNGDVLRAAALAGQGIAKLPTFLVGEDIAARRLRPVLDACPPTALGIHALWAPSRYLAAKTRVFVGFLVERFGPQPARDRFAQRHH